MLARSFSWDSEGRLTSATGAWGTRSYAYNGAGARVRETGGAAQRDFFRSGASVLAPVLRDGTGAGSFRYTPGLSVREHGASSSRFAHTGLKTTDSQTDGSAGLASTLTYDAFGSLTGSTGSWQGNYGYAGGFGYHADPTGLKQVGHRYYDPDLGRFLSRDPIKDGPNWYAYCLNDPVNRIDPTGLKWHDPTIVVVAPGFSGKVTAYGDFPWMKGDSWRDTEISPGHMSHIVMDVDYIVVTDRKGRTRRYFLLGAIPRGDGRTVNGVYVVDADGNVTNHNGALPAIEVTGFDIPIWSGWRTEAQETGFPQGFEPLPTQWRGGTGRGM